MAAPISNENLLTQVYEFKTKALAHRENFKSYSNFLKECDSFVTDKSLFLTHQIYTFFATMALVEYTNLQKNINKGSFQATLYLRNGGDYNRLVQVISGS